MSPDGAACEGARHGRTRSTRRRDRLARRPPLADDAALIAHSLADPEAFAAIFDRHALQIHRYAAQRLGNALADDVVGDTFLVAFRRRDHYDPAYRDARPWLFGIATNMISRHRQAEVRFYRALARTGVDPLVESPIDDVVARVAASAERRSLAAALARPRFPAPRWCGTPPMRPTASGSPSPGTTQGSRPTPS
jgi:hypothetical protein